MGEVIRFQIHPQSQEQVRKLRPAGCEPQSISYVQTAAVPGNEAAVEITRVLIPRPFAEVVEKIPPELWGYGNLDHWLGGERVVVEVDDRGRAVKQYERMVLSPFECDWSFKPINNDMTKAEYIEYSDIPGSESATVFWRVYASDNSTVDQDYGSVDFRAVHGGSTVVTFHSAHRLRTGGPLPLDIDPKLIKAFGVLERMFTDFASHYVKIATDSIDDGITPFPADWAPGMS